MSDVLHYVVNEDGNVTCNDDADPHVWKNAKEAMDHASEQARESPGQVFRIAKVVGVAVCEISEPILHMIDGIPPDEATGDV